MLTSEVHRNKDGTLYVLPSLVQQTFGVVPRRGQGRCLITQVAYSIAAVCPQLPASRIVTHVDKHVDRAIDECGHTIEELLDTFKHPVRYRDGYLKLDVQMNEVSSFDQVLVNLISGHPVIVIIDRDVCEILLKEAIAYGDGEIRSTVIRHGRSGFYHAMLAIGVDLAGYVIVRDSRHTYAYDGYAKISTQILQDGWRNVKMFTVDVTSATKV